MLARRVREQRQHERWRKVYSLHAPDVECIGKGKAHRPYEFGVKVSIATTLNRRGPPARGPRLLDRDGPPELLEAPATGLTDDLPTIRCPSPACGWIQSRDSVVIR
jgi:hypothetical protein